MNKLKDKKLIAVFSYIWFLSLIPLLMTDDKDVKFHSKQGTRLAIIYTPILILLIILNKIDFLYRVTDILIPIVTIIALVFSLLGTYDVIKNNKKELPLINKLFNRSKK